MSGYDILGLVFYDLKAVPEDPIEDWPGPVRDPDLGASEQEPGYVRRHGVDDQILGVFLDIFWDRSFQIADLFESYEIEAAAYTRCNDTTDVCESELYKPESDDVRDQYAEGKHGEHYGRGLQEYARQGWGFEPWTIWDFYDERQR